MWRGSPLNPLLLTQDASRANLVIIQPTCCKVPYLVFIQPYHTIPYHTKPCHYATIPYNTLPNIGIIQPTHTVRPSPVSHHSMNLILILQSVTVPEILNDTDTDTFSGTKYFRYDTFSVVVEC